MAIRVVGRAATVAGAVLMLSVVRRDVRQLVLFQGLQVGPDGRFATEINEADLLRAVQLAEAAQTGSDGLVLEARLGRELFQVVVPVDRVLAAARGGATVLDLGDVDFRAGFRQTLAAAVEPRPAATAVAAIPSPTAAAVPPPLMPITGQSGQMVTLSELQASIAERDRVIAAYTGEISKLTTARDRAMLERDRARAELDAANKTEQNLRNMLARTQTERLELETKMRDTTMDLERTAMELKRFQKQDQTLRQQLENRNQAVSDLEGRLLAADGELKTALAATSSADMRIKTLEAQVSDRETRIKLLEQTLTRPTEASKPVALASVIESLGEQIAGSADKVDELRAWTLSDVRLSLKVLVDEEGTKVRFPKPGEVTSPGEVSAVDIALRPGRRPQPQRVEVTVPDVIGYTSLVAERKLQAGGFSVETSYETVADVEGQPKRAGRVVALRPAPGSAVKPGSTIELLLGKA